MTSAMDHIMGIDIGATKTIFALRKDQQILGFRKVLTPRQKQDLITMIKRNVAELEVGRKIKGIGIGVPGPLDKTRDLILNPPNLLFLHNFPLAKVIEKELQIKTKMEKDVNCFTLGEAAMGAGKETEIVFGITLGSGVGGGLVLRSREDQMKPEVFIYWGAFGTAGEVGHHSIKFDGPKCSCGSRGCLEEYCSERFFLKNKTSPPELLKRAKKDDKKALRIFEQYGKNLGIGLANLVNILDPEVIVIGGGIATAYKFFIKEAKNEMKNRIILPISRKKVKIKKARLGEASGAIGASLLKF